MTSFSIFSFYFCFLPIKLLLKEDQLHIADLIRLFRYQFCRDNRAICAKRARSRIHLQFRCNTRNRIKLDSINTPTAAPRLNTCISNAMIFPQVIKERRVCMYICLKINSRRLTRGAVSRSMKSARCIDIASMHFSNQSVGFYRSLLPRVIDRPDRPEVGTTIVRG